MLRWNCFSYNIPLEPCFVCLVLAMWRDCRSLMLSVFYLLIQYKQIISNISSNANVFILELFYCLSLAPINFLAPFALRKVSRSGEVKWAAQIVITGIAFTTALCNGME